MSEHNFLQGGGEMGELIRARDWSQTPLGNPDTWSQSLKTMVSVLLGNPFGMYIAWGKEYTQIYNDGYRPILGDSKHPQALGLSTRETFSEVWHIIGSMFDNVMDGEAVGFPDFILPLNRYGYEEICYFDFAYSPIRLENGDVGGVLVTVIETTNKKKAELELQESKSELEFVIEAAQLATFDFNPITHKFTANARLKSWFGLPAEEMIELSEAINAIAERDRERVKNSIAEVIDISSSGIYDIEYSVVNKVTQKETIVHAKGLAWFNEDKIAYRLNGTLEDVTDKVLARKKIEESESNLRLMILQAPIAISILRGADYKVEIVNKYALELWGRTEEEVINKSVFESMPELLSQGIKELLDEVVNTSIRFATSELPVQLLRNGSLETVYINFSYEALYDELGKINGIMAIGFDVTTQVEARKKVEESEKRFHNLIYSSPSAIGILYGEDLRITIANDPILEIWGKGREIIGKSYFEALPELAEQGYKEVFAEVYKTGVPFNAIETPVHIVQNGEMTLKYYNFLLYPQKNIEGEVDGIGIIATEVTTQALLNQKIRESEQSIRSLVESAPFPIGVYVGEELEITIANQSIMDAWGKGNDVVGKLYTEVLPELQNQQIFEQIRGVLRTGIPFHAKNQRVDIEIEGVLESFYFNYSFTPLIDHSGKVYAVMNTGAEVTELNRAKHKVEESEKRFKDSVKQAPLGIAIFRGSNYVTEMANENYLQIVDKTEEQFVGKPLFESLPEVEVAVAPIIAEIYKTGVAYYGYEFPVKLNRYGNIEDAYFNFVYHPLIENNVTTGFMVVASDITANVKAKQLIEANEEKLNIVIDASELGTWEYDLATQVSSTSKKFLEIYGFHTQDYVPHERLLACMHPEDLDIRRIAFEKAFLTGILHYEARIIVNDTIIRWIEVKGKVFFDNNKMPERLVGTIRNITEERNFQQILMEREQKFRLLADSMPQHIWTSDTEGNLNYFNQSVFDFSGITQQDIDEKGWIQIVHPDDQDENMQKWKEAITTGKDFLIEHRFRAKNGEYRWQLSRAIPQRDQTGKIKMWVGTSTDIQDQKMFTNELERQVLERTSELNQKNIDLEKINKELQSFVYISSHDLQEPLRKIQTFASRILETEHENLSENGKKHFSRIQISANRMQNLIQDLFAYSRTNVEARKFETVHLIEIIEDIQETLREDLDQKKVTFDLINICELKIIPFQFKQLMLNLISNSIKFSRDNNPIHIVIDCVIAEGSTFGIDKLSHEIKYCHIKVSDNGIGFDQQYSERIFEVFQRLHGKEEYIGTGIGLAIVKKIVENHNGVIIASGRPYEGATFDIYIPAE